jgi:hypothetical protein
MVPVRVELTEPLVSISVNVMVAAPVEAGKVSMRTVVGLGEAVVGLGTRI